MTKNSWLCGFFSIVYLALSPAKDALSQQRSNFICTAKQVYFIDANANGQLYIPPNNYVAGTKFVVDRFTGEAQGALLDTAKGGWSIVINSTGNSTGDWNPSFTYHGQPSVLERGTALWPQIVRHNMTLSLNLTYTGSDELYGKLDEGKKVTFVLSNSSSITTGVCDPL